MTVGASTSPEIQEFWGILGIFKDKKKKIENKKKIQELVASYTIDIETGTFGKISGYFVKFISGYLFLKSTDDSNIHI